jgi:hypothetical protein
MWIMHSGKKQHLKRNDEYIIYYLSMIKINFDKR